jgi:AcrR family transcriptional regulator
VGETTLRERKKQQVRERILEVCDRLFREKGFDETTVDEVVAAVDVSRQTFFNYFPTKEAVLTELGLRWFAQQSEHARERVRGEAPERWLDGLRRVLREQAAAIERDRDFMRLVFTRSGALFPHGPQVAGPEDAPRLDRTRGLFAVQIPLWRALQESGRFRRDLPPEQIAEMYVAVMVVTMRLWLTDYWPRRESLAERLLRAFAVLEDGLRSRAEEKSQ